MSLATDQVCQRPAADEYNEYYDTYISKVPDGNILDQLSHQISEIESVYRSVSAEVAEQVHAPYTWTIKQVVGHLIDTERIFADRLHRFRDGRDSGTTGHGSGYLYRFC